MATIKHHEDLAAWQLANALKIRVLELVERTAVARRVRFCDQIERSSTSGPANLAEAFWKYRPKERAYFVRVAIASLGETQNHLRDCRDRRLMEEKEFSELWTLASRALGASIAWHSYLMSCSNKPPTPTSNDASERTPKKPNGNRNRKERLKRKP